MAEIEIGKVTNYFGKIRVAGIKLSEDLSIGDTVRILGHTTDFSQAIDSIQIDNQPVETAGGGSEIGLRVAEQVREHDIVYKVVG